MAVINNVATAVGDEIIVNFTVTDSDVLGLLELRGFDLVVDNVTTPDATNSKYFDLDFKFVDVITGDSGWIPILSGNNNYTKSNFRGKQVIVDSSATVSYRLTRRGTSLTNSTTNSPKFFSINTQGIVESLVCGVSFQKSIFSKFFQCHDSEITGWVQSVVPKMMTDTAILKPVPKNDQYEQWVKGCATFFSYIVNLARQYQPDNLLSGNSASVDFIKSRGLLVCGDETEQEIIALITKYYREISYRGTRNIGEVKDGVRGELLRLFCVDPATTEFIFNYSLNGWRMGYTSPSYRGTYLDWGVNKFQFKNPNIIDGSFIDSITIEYDSGRETIIDATTYTADSGSSTLTTYSNYSGAGYIDIPSDGDYIEFDNISSPSDQVSIFKFRYYSGSYDKGYNILVNGTDTYDVVFDGTTEQDHWKYKNVTINLTSGTNTVRITKTGGVLEDKLPLLNPSDITITSNAFNLFLPNDNGFRGIEDYTPFDYSYPIKGGLNYEVSFYIETEDVNECLVTVGVKNLDADKNIISIQEFVADISLVQNDTSYYFRGISYQEGTNISEKIDQYTTLGNGNNVVIPNNTVYLSPYIKVRNNDSTSNIVKISNVKVAPTSLPYSKCFMNLKNWVDIITINSGSFTNEKSFNIIEEELIPIGTRFNTSL